MRGSAFSFSSFSSVCGVLSSVGASDGVLSAVSSFSLRRVEDGGGEAESEAAEANDEVEYGLFGLDAVGTVVPEGTIKAETAEAVPCYSIGFGDGML